MVGDHRAIATAAVQPAADLRLRRRRARRKSHDAEPQRESHGGQLVAAADVHAPVARAGTACPREGPDAAEAVVEITFDVEVSRDVRTRQAELVRLPEQPTERAPVADHRDRGIGGARLAPVPRPDPDGEIVADELADGAGEGLGDSGAWHGQLPGCDSTSWATSRYPVAKPASQYPR